MSAAIARDDRPLHVVVVGLNEFLRRELDTVNHDGRYRFHTLYHKDEILHQDDYDIPALISEAEHRLRLCEHPIDGIVAHWDFPVSSLVPLLQRRFDLPGPDAESLAKCSNKYWSRMVQQEVVPECTPAFQCLDPFAEDLQQQIELDYPFWLKPVKGFGSVLGFRIEDAEQFDAAIARIREVLPGLGRPYDQMQEALLGPHHPRVGDGGLVLIEEIVGGREIAPEGSVHNGIVGIHGIIDMPRERGSFDRYEYPARLDDALAQRIIDVTERLIAHVGIDHTCFNVEYFYDEEADRLSIVEINPRMSQSHCYLFEQVDGISNHAAAVAVAVGENPRLPHRRGPYGVAGKCFLRSWTDGVVRHVPCAEEIAQIEAQHPDCHVELHVAEGQRLSERSFQDSYSTVLVTILVAGEDRDDMLRRRRAIEQALAISIDHDD